MENILVTLALFAGLYALMIFTVPGSADDEAEAGAVSSADSRKSEGRASPIR